MLLLSLEVICPICGECLSLSLDEISIRQDIDEVLLCSFECDGCGKAFTDEPIDE